MTSGKVRGSRESISGRWRLRVLPFFFGALLMALTAGAARDPVSREYQVKAVFLYNFAQFVEWPNAAFADPHAPLVIGVLGDNPFGKLLDEAVAGEKILDHPLLVEHFGKEGVVGPCHILYVSRSEADSLAGILPGLSHRNVLTVGDSDGFEKAGGMIAFRVKNNQVRFTINRRATEGAGLSVSSKLLRLADRSEEKTP